MKHRGAGVELIAESVADACAAERAGATRIELVATLRDGGLSPDAALTRAVRGATRLPVFVMVRPRAGEFCYTPEELAQMREQIASCKEIGVAGVVLGTLSADRRIDRDALEALVACARPLEITFHRAFDRVPDQQRALEELIALGIERVLSSGKAPTATLGSARIAQLVKQARDRIVVMPGGGVSATNVRDLVLATGAREVHSSCSSMTNPRVLDEQRARALVEACRHGDTAAAGSG